MEKKTHKLGEHVAICSEVRKGKKIKSICLECKKEVKDQKLECFKCKGDIENGGIYIDCGKHELKDQKVDVWDKKSKLELLSLEAKILKLLSHEDSQMFLEYIELVKTNFIAKSEVVRQIQNKKFTNGETGYRNLKKLDKYSYNQALQDLLKELGLE